MCPSARAIGCRFLMIGKTCSLTPLKCEACLSYRSYITIGILHITNLNVAFLYKVPYMLFLNIIARVRVGGGVIIAELRYYVGLVNSTNLSSVIFNDLGARLSGDDPFTAITRSIFRDCDDLPKL